MNSIIFAISLMLKIGVGGNILQSMCEQNGKYIEKHMFPTQAEKYIIIAQ